jgi:hypothetical protein
MKKARNRVREGKDADADDILPEYDFSRAGPNPYASVVGSTVRTVVLEPDVAASFPNSRAVNRALRQLAKNAGSERKTRKRRPRSA